MPFLIKLSRDQMKILMMKRKKDQWFLLFMTFIEHGSRNGSDETNCRTCNTFFFYKSNVQKGLKFLTCILQLRLFCYCGASFLTSQFVIRKVKRQMNLRMSKYELWQKKKKLGFWTNTMQNVHLVLFKCIPIYHLKPCGDPDSFILKTGYLVIVKYFKFTVMENKQLFSVCSW